MVTQNISFGKKTIVSILICGVLALGVPKPASAQIAIPAAGYVILWGTLAWGGYYYLHKTFESLLEGAKHKQDARPNRGNGAEQYEKDGGLPQAEKDFDSLNPTDVKVDPNSGTKYGKLPDGSTINVRGKSLEGSPTLEKYGPNGKQIKIRYK